MLALFSFLAVVTISLLLVRIATVALTLTGLSQQLARFQARSAFTGAGFTTTESEKVVQHPVRRRVIMLLMLLGNAGVVTGVSSLMLSFLGDEQVFGTWTRGALLIGGLAMLWWLATSAWVDKQMSSLIGWALRKYTSVEARDYAGLLHLTGDYVVAELAVTDGDWLEGRELSDLRLNREGLLVLGIERTSGKYLGVPRGGARLNTGDTVLLYGRRGVIADLDNRSRGQQGAFAHLRSVEQQKKIEMEEAQDDPQSADGPQSETSPPVASEE